MERRVVWSGILNGEKRRDGSCGGGGRMKRKERGYEYVEGL